MEELKEKKLTFKCPNCGEIHRDDVIFLCNKCESGDLVLIDDIYMCPSCLKPGENFECLICESTEVSMDKKEKTAKEKAEDRAEEKEEEEEEVE